MLSSRPVLRRVAGATTAALAVGVLPFVVAAPSASAAPTELFISEYVEGTSNNKALEVFNGTGAPVDLAAGGYNVQMFFNGSASAGLTINLVGSIAVGDVFVLAQSSADPAILAQADQTNGAGWFNGDDAVVLRKGTTVVDSIGQAGFDPGTEWGTDLTSTADNTLRRKGTIQSGDPNSTDAFDPAVEWDGYATNTFDGLGTHTLSGDAAPRVVSSTPADGATGVAPSDDLTVVFSEPVVLASSAFSLDCTASGAHDVTVSGGPTSFVLDPTTDLTPNDACSLTAHADAVSDVDSIDPPDLMDADAVVHFSTPLTQGCGDPFSPIHAIQGSGASTPLAGTRVAAEGVVVGDYEGASPQLRGFYLQAADGEQDGDAATSEGVFVFNGNDDDVALGDRVRVLGTATEFQGQTQIGEDTVVPCGGGATVTPTDVTFPVASDTYLERYEGMLTRLPQAMTVTEHFQLGRFGQVVLSQGGRLQQPTNVVAPGAPALELQAANDLRSVILDDDLNNQNPDPIVFGRNDQPLSASNTLRGGDTVTNATGVLTYTWAGNAASGNAYRVRPVDALGGQAHFVAANPRPSAAPAPESGLRVAGMNLLNFFNTFDGCTAGVGGASTDCRGAENQTEFDRQWPKTVAAVSGTGADVVAVMEVENDGYGPTSAEQFLVDRLNAKDGAGTWAFVDADAETGEVNALGTDAIKVGLLYKPSEVTPVGVTATLNTPEFVNAGDGSPRNRASLAQAFRDNTTGGVFIAVANHLKSKGSACDTPDAGDGQGNCNGVRTVAAGVLSDWLATDPTHSGDPDVLLLGDMNSYAKEDPIAAFETHGFTNLIASRLGADAYSYVFDGQWGYLDHALGSGSLTGQVASVADWHINADEPSVLDYNTNFKSAGQVSGLYAADEFRMSDHDPVLVDLSLTPSIEFATGSGWIISPPGALVADPDRSGKATFAVSAKYEKDLTYPSGSFSFDLTGFSVASTSLDWLVVNGAAARLAGPATVNGAAGYRFEATFTDASPDVLRLVVRTFAGVLVYDSGSQPLKGQVKIHG